MHYLDNSATTKVLSAAAKAAYDCMTIDFGNPSSLHSMGITSSVNLNHARETIAKTLDVTKNEIYFTSCGSESINTAILGVANKKARRGKHIISTSYEHAATLNTLRYLENKGFEVTYLKPDKCGNISVSDFKHALRPDTILVSMMYVNNELGNILPVTEVGSILKAARSTAIFHIDAVQAYGKIEINPNDIGCQLMSISGHKIGAPKGIGALFMSRKINIDPFILGGGQEQSFRGGTEAMPNIMAFSAAALYRHTFIKDNYKRVSMLRDFLLERLKEIPNININSHSDFPYIMNISIPNCKSEVMLRVLESDNVYVSSGSACSKGKHSHVLKAVGLSPMLIDSALRISFSPENNEDDILALITAIKKGIKMFKG